MASQTTCPWRAVTGVPALRAGQIHLWWVPLSATTREVESMRRVLSTDERKRADRYRFAEHTTAYILGRSTLRYILHGYTGRLPDSIGFEYGPLGKPELAGDIAGKRLSFNYSDAAGHAIYAFTWNEEIGVDLEDLNREISFERIVLRKFTQAEAEANLALPEAKRRSAFLACWTRKEGYGKAQGWGIHYPLDSVELCVNCATNYLRLPGGENGREGWTIRQIYPNDHFVGSLVYAGEMDAGSGPHIDFLTIEPATWLRP